MAGSLVSVEVIGAPEVIAKFRAISQIAARDLGYIMYRSALFMKTQAIANCPVVTGNLQSSIQESKLGVYSWEVSASSLAGSVPEKNSKEYASFVEYGTSRMSGRFFMRGAYNATVPFTNAQVAALAAKLAIV
jgi:HK97 gp10 family phage protein